MTIEELGAEFGKLIAQLFALNLKLAKELNEQAQKTEKLENQLKQTELKLIAAQGRQVIQDGDSS